MTRTALLLSGMLNLGVLTAQQPAPAGTATEITPHATTLPEAFGQGQFHGSFRTYWMATDNARQLTDYYAWAAGGGLHFNTASFYGFRFGLGGAFNFNLNSSDLAAKDSATGAANRYEIGLFDVEDPANRDNLHRLEELWLRYERGRTRLTVGKQSIQTPFINYQDGRMRPTVESGIWAETGALKNTEIKAGWLWGISPRSTVRWYGIGESIGLYPKGLNPEGTASGYPDHLQSKGVGLLGVAHRFGKDFKVQLWDQYVEHIFNTALIQADYVHPLRHGHALVFGGQYTRQDAVADGGNPEADKTYFTKGGRSNAFSAQAGWQHGSWQALAAYTRVTKDGRFLSPREWGREPFYTFMPRERVEGSGDVHAFTGRLNWHNPAERLHIGIAYGHFYLPDIRNTALNKYAFPAFNQLNLDARYTFDGAFRGLRAQFLYVRKGRIGETYGNDKSVINKVDMSSYNLILNYTY